MRNHLKSGPEPLQNLNLWFNKRRQLNVKLSSDTRLLLPLFYQLKLILLVLSMYYTSYFIGNLENLYFNKHKDAGLLILSSYYAFSSYLQYQILSLSSRLKLSSLAGFHVGNFSFLINA